MAVTRDCRNKRVQRLSALFFVRNKHPCSHLRWPSHLAPLRCQLAASLALSRGTGARIRTLWSGDGACPVGRCAGGCAAGADLAGPPCSHPPCYRCRFMSDSKIPEIQVILSEVDELLRERLQAAGLEIGHTLVAISPDGAGVVRSNGGPEGLGDIAEMLADITIGGGLRTAGG